MKNSKKNDVTPKPVNERMVFRWGSRRIWLNLAFLFLTLGIAVFSVEQAHWVYPEPLLTLILFVSVAVVWLLNSLRLPWWLLHLASLSIGFLVFIWQGMVLLPEGSGIGTLFGFFSSWWQGGEGLRQGDSQILFGELLVILTWLTGYLSTWFVLRHNNAWVAVISGTLIIIANLGNLPGKYYFFFVLFTLAAVSLVIQTNVIKRQALPGNVTDYSRRSVLYLLGSLLCITVLTATISWGIPQVRVTTLQNAIASAMPWKNVEESGLNILRSIPSKRDMNTTWETQTLEFGQLWNIGDNIQYTVVSPVPAYWQVSVYDLYNSRIWLSSPAEEKSLKQENDWKSADTLPGHTRIVYEVIPSISTDIVLLTGDFVSAEVPVTARIDVVDEVTNAKLPRVLNPGEKYTVRVLVADKSPSVLSAAGVDYPEEITDAYLQLPQDLPDRITTLSEDITANATTPYEKVLAIDKYLSRLPYSLEVEELPEGSDAVSDFLFTQKKGFCLHFASAMAVMLRSVEVPSRLVVGYLPGDPGKEKDTYYLRDKHYHAWTQVYFPDYGWIDFEPTPAGASGSQVSLESPLISGSDIRQLPSWEFWYFSDGFMLDDGSNSPSSAMQSRRVTDSRLAFSNELGTAIIIIGGALIVFGIILGISRIVRPFYSRRIWNVDRERLPVSTYASLCRLAGMNGIDLSSRQTPLESLPKIAEIIPEQSKELEFLVQSYVANQFGRDKGKIGLYEEAEILKARVLVFEAILQKQGKVQRFFWKP